MNFTSRKLLAAALLAAIPMSSALACTTANWTAPANGGGQLGGAPTAGSPPTVARYSGKCGLAGATGNFVTNNAPDNESVYRARFYVYTSNTGTTTVFRATAADNNAGAEVLRVDYTPGTFSFFQNGAAAGTVTGAGVVANRWYAVELSYKAGVANTGFSATVAGNVNFTGSTTPVTAGAGTIGSHSLGAIAGGAGTVRVDAFESTRSADTAIGRLCRGDANGDGNINVFDTVAITSERVTGTLASGQPDCNEDGAVNVFDTTCAVQLRVNAATCN